MRDSNLEHAVNETAKIKVAIRHYSTGYSDAGAAVAAAILHSAGRFKLERDLKDYLEIKHQLQLYGSGGSEAGANIGAALIWNSRESNDGMNLRSQVLKLQTYGTSESSAGASIALGLLAFLQKKD